jgi:hypothetical protein
VLAPAQGGAGADAPQGVDALPAKLKKLIKTGDASGHGDDRSRLVWYITCSLIRLGWSDEAIKPILLDEKYGCSEHCRDQSNKEKYAQKQIADAREAVANDWERDDKGRILTGSQANIRRALANLRVQLGYDEFADLNYMVENGRLHQLEDKVIIDLRLEVDKKYGFLPNKDLFFDVWGTWRGRTRITRCGATSKKCSRPGMASTASVITKCRRG